MKVVKFGAIALSLFLLNACSVYMAAHQPSQKNEALFKVGTSRDILIAEFGVPATSGVKNGKKYEIYRFTQGYSQGNKAARALVEGTADVFTLGLTEVITTPVESINDGSLRVYEVTYDGNDLVDQVTVLMPSANPSSAQPSAAANSQPVQPAAQK